MKIAGTLRAVPSGNPVIGTQVKVYTHANPGPPSAGSPIGTDTTDAQGRWDLTLNGNPGPYYWEATYTDPLVDVTRRGSSKSYGSGGSYSLAELPIALRVRGNGYVPGYLNGFSPVTLASGVTLNVPTGAVMALGIPAVWHTASTYAVVAARDGTNPKLGYLGVRVFGPDHPTEPGKAVLAEEVGTAAASPSLPALGGVQTETSYFVPLWSFRLRKTGDTPAIDTFADVRQHPTAGLPIVSSIVRRTDPVTGVTITDPGGVNVTGLTTTITLASGIIYDLSGRVWLVSRVNAAPTVAHVAVFLDGTSNLSEFVQHASTSDLGVGNAHSREGVVGTGAAISCGARVKVSGGGNMTYTVGYFQVVARPRS